MKKYTVITLFICWSSFSLSQDIENKKQLIAQIEGLSNWSQVFLGTEFKHSSSIEYNSKTNYIKITEFSDWGKKFNLREIAFYLDDIDKSSFRYSFIGSEADLYIPYIEITTHNKSVQWKKMSWNKGQKSLTMTEEKYNDKIRLGANANNMSKYLCEKYIDYWYQLTESKSKAKTNQR